MLGQLVTVNPIVTKGYAFAPFCLQQRHLITTKGYGHVLGVLSEVIEEKSCITKIIKLHSKIKGCIPENVWLWNNNTRITYFTRIE